ncbi:alpha/beta-hydrolase [Aspergillus heteromorphus CBS 117.55]|uniref:Alpha/beta-hydrolase n=1 Tax=Aspergillus heteromorphus CBS 117.55 TaxID=1448321 RepID=A0A317WS16_9EURO|nr:alpha/beta-hydrolase [Aspergillus heteromorphus CBS 117.55]PWY89234.1 alpha/beta-hydrolase [Aspergillus heteromorphus CBS 117.55]
MPSAKTNILAISIAILTALLSSYVPQINQVFVDKAVEHGIALPQILILPPTVTDVTRDVKYIGSFSAGVDHFQNIFYAEEPTGPRRFAPPVPVKPAKGSVIDATRPGAWCPQGTGVILPFTSLVTNVSENCLSLRIARPRGVKRGEKLPVVVYLHGGGHALGSASDILYNPDGLVKEAVASGTPVIYVGINYRLGFFGFATSRAMIETKQTNAGLRDQRSALEWVRDNIEAFGGDPMRVTAIGQSVGASDIGLHLLSFNGTQGVPFQQAVMMSGAPGLNFNSNPELVANNTANIASQVGCVDDADSQSIKTLECLRTIPADVLTNLTVTSARAARPPFGEGYFYPTIDKDFLHGRPSELLRDGKLVKGVPIIASWVANDGAWYAPPHSATDEEVLDSFGLWLYNLSSSTKERLLDLYPVEEFDHMVREGYDGPISAHYYRAAQMNRDIWFTCPVLDFTWNYVQNKGANLSDVWLYEHNATRYTPVFEAMGVPMWRVAHLSDIPYVLNNPGLVGGADNSDDQRELGRTVSRAIIGFVHSGTPQSEARSWPFAFSGIATEQLLGDYPTKLTIQVFGGDQHAETVTVSKDDDSKRRTVVENAVSWERLFDRCEFINSPQMRQEAGV